MSYTVDNDHPATMLVAGRYTVPIVKIVMHHGTIVFYGLLAGPIPKTEGRLTIFGEDGRGIAQSSPTKYPAIPEGDSIEIQWETTVVTVGETVCPTL